MGSSPSKPVALTATEKAQTYQQPTGKEPLPNSSSSPSHAHHAADRLHRIAAEANISRLGSASTSTSLRQQQHQVEMPAHVATHAEVNLAALKAWDAVALEDPTSRLAAMTLHNTVIRDSIRRRTAETADHHVFSHTIPMHGTPVVNQLSSGRCWLFATTNVIRLQVMKELNIKEFELSQSYLAFWDKLEKSNTFLENSIELADVPLDDRVFGFLKTAPTNDGGQWDMVTNLIKKYGLVPKAIFPESYNSSNSSQINWLITLKLREYALELRQLKKTTTNTLKRSTALDSAGINSHVLHAVRTRKDEQMAEVYRMMVIALGVPPKPDDEFTFEYYDANGKFNSVKTTAKGFLEKYTGSFDPSGACSLVNDPRRAYNKLITVDRLQNVWGGQPVLYVNTSTKQMKESVIASIKAGLPVFFGCDVGQFSERKGIMDTDLYDYELAFGIKLGLTKAERLELGESSMTHAMVITGVHLDVNGRPVRYRVENSWGVDAGEKGYMVMTDAWFDEFVYQVVIRKQHMPSSLWKLFTDGINDETDVLPPYDPMGSLASITATTTMDVDAYPDPSSGAVAAEGDDGDDSSSIPEDEYEIEAILSHEVGHFPGKKNENDVAYLVSWKGYGPEHNSWVKESDAENATDIIQAYWASANKAGVTKKARGHGYTGSRKTIKKEKSPEVLKVVRRTTTTTTTKRKARSMSKSVEEQAARKRSATAREASYSRAGVDVPTFSAQADDSEMEERTTLTAEELSQERKKQQGRAYQRMADWENVVHHVETVERTDEGKLIAFVIFENGVRYAYEAAILNHRCPQKMIQFYESRLRFKKEAADLPPLQAVPAPTSSQAVQSQSQSQSQSDQRETDAADQVMAEGSENVAQKVEKTKGEKPVDGGQDVAGSVEQAEPSEEDAQRMTAESEQGDGKDSSTVLEDRVVDSMIDEAAVTNPAVEQAQIEESISSVAENVGTGELDAVENAKTGEGEETVADA